MKQLTSSAMAQEQFAEQLRQFAADIGLNEELVRDLTAAATVRAHRAGDVLFRENTASDELLLVISGSVALEIYVPQRGNVRILSLGPGELVGWSALLGSGQMTTSATVVSAAQIAAFSAREIDALCERNPSFGYHVMRHLAKALANRLVATRLQLLDLFSDSRRPAPVDPYPR